MGYNSIMSCGPFWSAGASRTSTVTARATVVTASLLCVQCDLLGLGNQCTDVLNYNRATIDFVPPIQEAGSWCFEVQSDAVHCVACYVTSSADAGYVDTPDTSISNPPLPTSIMNVPRCPDTDAAHTVDVIVSSREGDSIDYLMVISSLNLEQIVPSLTYKAYLGDELRYERQVNFTFLDTEPNGAGCGVNHSGAVETPP